MEIYIVKSVYGDDWHDYAGETCYCENKERAKQEFERMKDEITKEEKIIKVATNETDLFVADCEYGTSWCVRISKVELLK